MGPSLPTGGLVLAALLLISPLRGAAGQEDSSQITAEEIRDHVEFLASDDLQGRRPGSAGWRKAAAYVEGEFRALGLLPLGDDETFFQEVRIPGQNGRNILGLLPGSSPSRGDQVIILSSHYDHLGIRRGQVMNGADDDASGVAVMLEVAEALARSKEPLQRGVLFACFDLEERGLLGALYYALMPAVPMDKTVVNINLEVLGNDILEGIPDSLFAIGTEFDEAGVLRERIAPLARSSGLDVQYLSHALLGPRGDHAAFRLRGVPFLFLAAGTTHTYHQPTDDPETLNYRKLEKEGRFVRDLVKSLAEGRTVPAFRSPKKLIRGEDAEVLRGLTEVMLQEGEELRLTKSEKAFLKRTARKMGEIYRSEEISLLDQASLALSFKRALDIITRPR